MTPRDLTGPKSVPATELPHNLLNLRAKSRAAPSSSNELDWERPKAVSFQQTLDQPWAIRSAQPATRSAAPSRAMASECLLERSPIEGLRPRANTSGRPVNRPLRSPRGQKTGLRSPTLRRALLRPSARPVLLPKITAKPFGVLPRALTKYRLNQPDPRARTALQVANAGPDPRSR